MKSLPTVTETLELVLKTNNRTLNLLLHHPSMPSDYREAIRSQLSINLIALEYPKDEQ